MCSTANELSHLISISFQFCGATEIVLLMLELTRKDSTAAMLVKDFAVLENMTFLVTTEVETIDVSYFLFKPP